MTKKKVLFSILFLFILAGAICLYYIRNITSTSFNIEKSVYIYIDGAKNYQSILDQLDTTAHIENIEHFKQLATYKKYPENIKTGRYKIDPTLNIKDLIRNLELGHQAPLNIRFNNIRLKKDLAERLDKQLMISDANILNSLNDPKICESYGFDTATIIAMFIPNTYEVYWDLSTQELLKRMQTEYKKFWNQKRLDKAQNFNLSPIEVSTLASIVEEECYFTDEYPMVAGLYLNRLKRGQLLQADPTVKYAVGDFSLKRILFKHLEKDSPYNTYIYEGLPPGPIRMPSIKAIDAVLNPAQHDYLYMCAKEDFSGRHRFAKTHAEHERNATLYRNALNARRIYK